jgi:hypothetical protein
MVHVARFVAQLREGLKLACDADSSAYRIYWYGYEPEGREFESPRARHFLLHLHLVTDLRNLGRIPFDVGQQ